MKFFFPTYIYNTIANFCKQSEEIEADGGLIRWFELTQSDSRSHNRDARYDVHTRAIQPGYTCLTGFCDSSAVATGPFVPSPIGNIFHFVNPQTGSGSVPFPRPGGPASTNGARLRTPNIVVSSPSLLRSFSKYWTNDYPPFVDFAFVALYNDNSGSPFLQALLFTAQTSCPASPAAGTCQVFPGAGLPLLPSDAVLNPASGSYDPSTFGCTDTCASTPWVESLYDLPIGTYYIEIGVSNVGDTALAPGLAFEFEALPIIAE